jgi:hypothetical protein
MAEHRPTGSWVESGIRRRVFDCSVQFLPEHVISRAASWDYAVFKFPFVPGFHVCLMEDDLSKPIEMQEFILSTHKTLHEAMGLCALLLANGGAYYDCEERP